MKIAICSPVELRLLAPYFQCEPAALPAGLSSTIVTLLVAALLARGHEVTLFTVSRDVEEEVVLRGPGLTAFVGRMRSSKRARNLWADEIGYLAKVIKRERPAFVHAHWTYEFALASLRSGVPTLTTIHDLPWNVLRYFRDPYRAARVLMAYLVAARGKNYTAVSQDAARHFRRYFRPGACVTVVPNFLSDAIFAQGLDQSAEPHPLTYCTILQGWSTRKNGKTALQAFALARTHGPASRLLMIGTDYEPGGPAETWARQHDLAEAVEFRGPLAYETMLTTFQKEADVLVHPSLDESFSMVALEAMALHKPVIAGRRTPGVREVLEFGKSGLLVNVKSPRALAAAMERLGSDPAARRTIAATAYASAQRRFRAEPVLLAYEKLYREFAARSSDASPAGQSQLQNGAPGSCAGANNR